MKPILYIILIGFTALLSCQKQENLGASPSQRNLQNITELRKELTEAPFGWKVIYFPKMDSLLFANKDQVLETSDPNYTDNYGYGGFYFLMKFDPKGTVQMRADYNEKSLAETQESQFEIKQNTFTQLSFTTYNYIHQLVNNRFVGNSDFLYSGKNFDNHLVFKTASYTEPAREYMVFQKLTSEAEWENGTTASNFLSQAYANRKFFDQMKNPQITIRQGSKTYFKSDVLIKTNSSFEPYQRFLKDIPVRRYYLFRFRTNPTDPLRVRSTGLGSGYVGTEQGITFRTGIRYNETYIFRDFQREGNKFTCELVKMYDPIRKRQMLVSKHLYPEGEPTYFVAEITDEPINP